MHCVLETNPSLLNFLIAFTLVTNLLCTVFLIKPLPTKTTDLLKSVGTVFGLPTSILSTSTFKLAKSNFAAKLDVSTPVALFKSTFDA